MVHSLERVRSFLVVVGIGGLEREKNWDGRKWRKTWHLRGMNQQTTEDTEKPRRRRRRIFGTGV